MLAVWPSRAPWGNQAERYYGLRGERLYTVQNCAAAIENMLIEAQSLGLGTNWVGGFDEDANQIDPENADEEDPES